MRSTEVLIRSAGALFISTEVLIRSAGALIRSTEVLIRTGVLCHLITGLRQFSNYMSSVTYCFIIEAFLATLCVHEYCLSYSCSRFKFIFMFHEHIYTFCIFYIFLVSCLFHMAFQIFVRYDAYPHIIHVF